MQNKFKIIWNEKIIQNRIKNNDNISLLREIIEFQFNLGDFNKKYSDIVFDDFLEIIIQFAFVTLFAMSFPLIPLIAWITNILEIEVDKLKLLRLYKRPIPYAAKDIGNWMTILEILSYISIFSNLGLLIFNSNSYYGLDPNSKLLLFSGLCVFYCLCKIAIDKLIPDLPKKIAELKMRLVYVSDKLKKIYFKKEIKFNKDKKIDLNVYTCN